MSWERLSSQVSTVDIRHWGGAMARPGPDAGPVGHRAVPFSVIDALMPAPGLPKTLSTYAIGGSVMTFLADRRGSPPRSPKRTTGVYGR